MASSHPDFDAARGEQRRSEGAAHPLTFELRGETFSLIASLPAWTLLELQAADEAHVTEAAQAIIGFFHTVIVSDDWARFERIVRSGSEPVETDELMETVRAVVEAFTQRPTVRPSDSPAGPSSTGTSSTPTSSPTKAASVRRLPSSRAQTG